MPSQTAGIPPGIHVKPEASPTSTSMAAAVDASWSEHSAPPPPQTPSIEPHGGIHWDLANFSMDSFLGSGGAGDMATRQQMQMAGAENNHHHLQHNNAANIRVDLEPTILSPTESQARSSAEPDGIPSKSRKRKGMEIWSAFTPIRMLALTPSPGSRTVSSLTPAQLERKRSNDRRAQRAIRERTKRRMEDYQNVVAQKDDMIMALSRRVQCLEEELARLTHGEPCSVATQGKKNKSRKSLRF